MATEIDRYAMIQHILSELGDPERVIEEFNFSYEWVEIPSGKPYVVREHTGRRTLTITTIPKPKS